MVSSDAYLAMVRDRLVEDGCEVTEEAVGSLPAMVGYRSNIRALSKLHLFTIVASVPEVNAVTVRDFSRQASDYAKGQKGRLRGAQSGVLALAALVTPKADDAAKKIAANPFRLGVGGFAAMVQPAVVDLTEGRCIPSRVGGCGVRRSLATCARSACSTFLTQAEQIMRSIHHDDPQHRDGPCLARPAHDRPRRQPNR